MGLIHAHPYSVLDGVTHTQSFLLFLRLTYCKLRYNASYKILVEESGRTDNFGHLGIDRNNIKTVVREILGECVDWIRVSEVLSNDRLSRAQ
jgi:hypothetical protein